MLAGARSGSGVSLADAAEQIKALGVDPGKVDQAVALIAAQPPRLPSLTGRRG